MSSLGLLFPVYGQGNANNYLEESVKSIKNRLEAPILEQGEGGALTRIETIMDYITPVIITLGILMAFLGAYKMMTTDKEDALKEGGKLVLYGVIGIIVISSAEFLANTLVNDVINANINTSAGILNGLQMSDSLYENIMLPFLKLVSYLAIGVLFFIMVGRVISFLVSSDEGVRKKAGGMIARTVIGILVIMAAKEIVEAIFGRREDVFPTTPETLGDIGTGIYEVSNIPIIYQVINWVMGLAVLVVLVLIIFQTFQLLTKPDSPDTISKIKKTLMYVVIGVLVIGAGYIISNVLLINPGTGQ
jgi:hypothetical protein